LELADLGLEHVAAVGALEQEKISAAHQRTFCVEIDEPVGEPQWKCRLPPWGV
jgi:hypothetical protein